MDKDRAGTVGVLKSRLRPKIRRLSGKRAGEKVEKNSFLPPAINEPKNRLKEIIPGLENQGRSALPPGNWPKV